MVLIVILKKLSGLNYQITQFNHILSFVVLINYIKIAVPVKFSTVLVPSVTTHNAVGNNTVNDNSKNVIPTETKVRPKDILFTLTPPLVIIV